LVTMFDHGIDGLEFKDHDGKIRPAGKRIYIH
jgi:hypothetical protein